MSAPFANIYTHRKVAEASAKACDICYKPSTSVLVTPNSKDFFYVCPVHLKDRNFALPRVDEEAAKARRERELAEEMEKVKKEYQERQKRNKDKAKDKKDADKDKAKDGSGDEDAKPKQDGGNDDDAKKATPPTEEQEPRVFELKSVFYQQRLLKRRQAESAKRDRERVSQPGYFPSVPTDLPGK